MWPFWTLLTNPKIESTTVTGTGKAAAGSRFSKGMGHLPAESRVNFPPFEAHHTIIASEDQWQYADTYLRLSQETS